MTAVPTGFFVTGAERSEFERINENLHQAIYRPTFSEIMALTERAKLQREGEASDGKVAEDEGDTRLADACRRRVAEIDETLTVWRQRWREFAGAAAV